MLAGVGACETSRQASPTARMLAIAKLKMSWSKAPEERREQTLGRTRSDDDCRAKQAQISRRDGRPDMPLSCIIDRKSRDRELVPNGGFDLVSYALNAHP